MSLTGTPVIYGIHPHETSEVAKHQLGVKGVTSDGREYRYAQNAGAEVLNPGQLCVAPDVTGTHEDIPIVNVVAIGGTNIVVTVGGAVVGNEYEEGFMNITDGTAQGIMYKIANCPVIGAGGNITIRLAEPIRVATVAGDTVTLYRNKYRDIVVSDGELADLPVGVPNVTFAVNEYGWIQTKGPCSVLVDTNTAVTAGLPVTIGDITAGAVEVIADITEPIVGHCPKGAVADTQEYTVIELSLDC